MPAFEGAPLYQHDSKNSTDTSDSDRTSNPPDLGTEREEGERAAGENDTAEKEQRQSDQSAEDPPSVTPETFPVVVFSHGLGAMRTMSCGICSDIASQGFVVAAVEHRCIN